MKKLIAVLAILAMAGAANAAITAELVLEGSYKGWNGNASDPQAFDFDLYNLVITNGSTSKIDTIGLNDDDPLKITGSWLEMGARQATGGLEEDPFGTFMLGETIYSPASHLILDSNPLVAIDLVETTSELSWTSMGLNADDHIAAGDSVVFAQFSTTGALGASNWVVKEEGVMAIGNGNSIEPIVYVPEPATMALLGLGGLAVLRRRRA